MTEAPYIKNDDKEYDCERAFRKAYENRYTWGIEFTGYQGSCRFTKDESSVEGSFLINKDFKVVINHISDDTQIKSISSQLFEVVIHRVKRSFKEAHGQNTFKYGDVNSVGKEVIVGGKNKGDRYRIEGDVITMVYRQIHGSIVQIFTNEVIHTGKGYLSKSYTSQYIDPHNNKYLSGKNKYIDYFSQINSSGPWCLSKRIIEKEHENLQSVSREIYEFFDLKLLD